MAAQPTTSTGQTMLGKLAEQQMNIQEAMKWDELGPDEKVERLRGFTKQAIADLVANQAKQISKMEKRLSRLEEHRHNTAGQIIVERIIEAGRLNRGFADEDDMPSMPAPTIIIAGQMTKGYI